MYSLYCLERHCDCSVRPRRRPLKTGEILQNQDWCCCVVLPHHHSWHTREPKPLVYPSFVTKCVYGGKGGPELCEVAFSRIDPDQPTLSCTKPRSYLPSIADSPSEQSFNPKSA